MNKIRQAFQYDCNLLIENFVKSGSPQFIYFCQEWKRMHVAQVYSPLSQDVEIVLLTAELFLVVKQILVNRNNRTYLERICALYLLYALYFKQPTEEFTKIKLTLEDWRSVKELLVWIDEQSDTMQAKVIFWKLFNANAFRFVYSEFDYGFEHFYQRPEGTLESLEIGKAVDIFKKDIKEIKQANTGLLSAFEDLEDGYNEMKELMNKQNQFGQNLCNTNIFCDLKASMSKIEKILIPGKDSGDEGSDKSQSEFSCDSIRARRSKLRKKAFSRPVEKKVHQKTDQYDISLQGDFLQITTRGEHTSSINNRKSVNILSEELPQESLLELRRSQPSKSSDTHSDDTSD